MFHNNYKWNIIFKNCESLCCTPVTYIVHQLYLNKILKFKNVLVISTKVAQSCTTLCDPHGLYSPWNSPGQNTGVGSLSLLWGNLSNPGIKPRSPTLQADSLLAEPQGKPKNIGVGSLSFYSGSSWPRIHGTNMLNENPFDTVSLKTAVGKVTCLRHPQQLLQKPSEKGEACWRMILSHNDDANCSCQNPGHWDSFLIFTTLGNVLSS